MNNNFYDIKKLAEKILYNSFWPTYIPNFYYWSSPETAKEKSLENDTKLIELTFEGHTHQFIFNHSYVGGYGGTYDVEIIHWPSCKYCETNQ